MSIESIATIMSRVDEKMPLAHKAPREGEVALADDPAAMEKDAGLVFIGRVRSRWAPGDCPKSMRAARESGHGAALEIAVPYRRGLAGLAPGGGLLVLTWLGGAQRNLIVQKPRHALEPKGVFALRSPVRPNPVGLHTVRILEIDREGGRIGIDAIDAFDGTPILDLKPHLPAVDILPETEG